MKTAIISDNFPEFIRELKHLNFEVIPVSPYKNNVDNPESSHADMQILNVNNKI